MIYCGEPIDNIPYHLTIPQFLLDSHHLERPLRKGQIPWIVDDSTGRSYGIEEVRARVAGLANSLYNEYGISKCLCIVAEGTCSLTVFTTREQRY